MIVFISQLSFKFNPYFRYTGTANRTGIPNLFDDVSIRIAYRHTGTHPYLAVHDSALDPRWLSGPRQRAGDG